MPKRVPTLADYNAANPYNATESTVAARKHTAWQAGASGLSMTVEGQSDAARDAYDDGCTWRADWDDQNAQFTFESQDGLPRNHKSVMSTKTFDHQLGMSCAFRQWRAQSHCRFLHGYALGFKFTFAADTMSHEGWVVDFGGLKDLKGKLEDTFDHKLLVAEDDPQKDEICGLAGLGIADVVVVPHTGCEAFARMVYDVAEQWLKDAGFAPRVRLVSVEVSEHGANSAIAQG